MVRNNLKRRTEYVYIFLYEVLVLYNNVSSYTYKILLFVLIAALFTKDSTGFEEFVLRTG